MSCIKCTHPKVIMSPYFAELYRTCDYIVTPTRRYKLYHRVYYVPFKRWTVSAQSVSVDTVDDFYFLSSDGSCYRMYMTVPCGKCILCNDVRRKEWSFRAICEARYSSTVPLFITLTYDDDHLPDAGLVKSDIQLWLKRLRIALDRRGIDHRLRYFICGEYGTKTHRPHYHCILYNMPKLGSWADVDFLIRSTWTHGFIMVDSIKSGGVGYVMKYMYKDSITPIGKSKPFYLSSRRNGGLGIDYCNEMSNFFRSHPDQLTITATDPYTGVSMTVALPRYFKSKIFPTRSQLVDKEIRDAFARMQMCYLSIRTKYAQQLDLLSEVSDNYIRLLNKFCFLPVIPIKTYNDFILSDTLDQLWRDYFDCCNVLDLYVCETDYVLGLLDNLYQRQEFILTLNYDDIDIDLCVEKLNYTIDKQKDREIF